MSKRATLRSTINKIRRDEFGRPSGVLALCKPAGITAHDLVDEVRKKLGTRRVGHAGALDTFATGLMLILVGKDTKQTVKLINLDKVYRARILFGVATTTQDPEGEVSKLAEDVKLNSEEVKKVLEGFKGRLKQHVSPYSSVKVGGKKLRKLMRDGRYNAEIIKDIEGVKKIRLSPKDPETHKEFEVEIPQKEVTIFKITLEETGELPGKEIRRIIPGLRASSKASFPFVDISVHSSKGTYIRQLAEDIGDKLDLPAMLIKLERSSIADINLDDAVDLNDLE